MPSLAKDAPSLVAALAELPSRCAAQRCRARTPWPEQGSAATDVSEAPACEVLGAGDGSAARSAPSAGADSVLTPRGVSTPRAAWGGACTGCAAGAPQALVPAAANKLATTVPHRCARHGRDRCGRLRF